MSEYASRCLYCGMDHGDRFAQHSRRCPSQLGLLCQRLRDLRRQVRETQALIAEIEARIDRAAEVSE